jgi:hypothetical protein
MQTQFTQAFRNARVFPSTSKALVAKCISAITKQEAVKPNEEQKRGWSTHLSYKTYQELKAQGIMQ